MLLAGYAILDGFDLGVGILHLCVRKDAERRVLMNSIGPLWDGNEVWLVVFGGAMFAAFPGPTPPRSRGFYTPFMLVLFALIFRGVSMEFRGKQDGRWRRSWDVAFCAASTLASFYSASSSATASTACPWGPTAISERAMPLRPVRLVSRA